MGTAYTPGLKVSSRTTIEKLRRLPLKGEVVVGQGDTVTPHTVVARTELPGIMQTVKVAERMGIEPADLAASLKIRIGDLVAIGDILAETKGLFGKFFRNEFKSPVAGKVELISASTGHVGVRQAPTPIEKDAYIRGTVTQVMPSEGVVITCHGALIQGIFGVGGERLGELAIVTNGPDEAISDQLITTDHKGKVVVGGSNVSASALRKAAQVGAIGIVCGGVVDRDLMDYLAEALNQPGYDIGVAITGQEQIQFSLVVTEGFGAIAMAARTFNLLKSLEGKLASINGATQIRAGVIRPEVIVPLDELPQPTPSDVAAQGAEDAGQLAIGTPIRVIREPYFGILGTVSGLPSELIEVESETMVRVLEASLDDGRRVTVPRANVEIIEG